MCRYSNGELLAIDTWDRGKEAEDMHQTAIIEVVNIVTRVAVIRRRFQHRRRRRVAFLRKASQFPPLFNRLRHPSGKPSACEAAKPIEHPVLSTLSTRWPLFGPYFEWA